MELMSLRKTPCAPITSTGQIFHLFPELVLDLRLEMWDAFLKIPQVIGVKQIANEIDNCVEFIPLGPHSPLLQVNREARKHALKIQGFTDRIHDLEVRDILKLGDRGGVPWPRSMPYERVAFDGFGFLHMYFRNLDTDHVNMMALLKYALGAGFEEITLAVNSIDRFPTRVACQPYIKFIEPRIRTQSLWCLRFSLTREMIRQLSSFVPLLHEANLSLEKLDVGCKQY